MAIIQSYKIKRIGIMRGFFPNGKYVLLNIATDPFSEIRGSWRRCSVALLVGKRAMHNANFRVFFFFFL